MINAWSLAASVLNGTFDEDYPIMKKITTQQKWITNHKKIINTSIMKKKF